MLKKIIALMFLLCASINADEVSPIVEYVKQLSSLTESENWKGIVRLGQRALKDKEATDTDRAMVHAQMASCYYYLGEFEEVENHAISCQALSRFLKKPDLLVRSLYLLSSHKRALGNAADFQNTSVYFRESKKWIHKALSLIDQCEDDFTKAKVYYNAGAIYGDASFKKIEKARDYYLKSMKLFEKLGKTDDLHRVAIRLGKLYLLNEKYTEAEKLCLKTKPHVNRDRTLAQLWHLEAQIQQSKGATKEAIATLNKAIPLAEKLEMKADLSRMRQMMVNISNSR